MRVALILFILLALGCQKEELGVFRPGVLVQDVQGTVIRVTTGNLDGNFSGVIVDAINPSAICNEVSASKEVFQPCEGCRDYCNQ